MWLSFGAYSIVTTFQASSSPTRTSSVLMSKCRGRALKASFNISSACQALPSEFRTTELTLWLSTHPHA